MSDYIISADPGVENFSLCVQKLDSSTGEIEVERVELLKDTLHSLLEKATPPFNDQVDLFSCYFENVLKTYKPKNVSMERYQVRGFRASGAAAELINIMLGLSVLEARKQLIPFRLVIAGEWKNHFNRVSEIPLKELYKMIKKLPPHCIDSMLIGWYCNKAPVSYYTKDNLLMKCSQLKKLLDSNSNA